MNSYLSTSINSNLKYFYILLLFFFFSGCSSEVENRVTGDNLTVYFPDVKNEALAEKVAMYWKENDLITGKDQDIQLVNSKAGYQLNLIQTEAFKNEPVNFQEQKLLSILRDSLQNNIFKTSLTIAICDNKFAPIYTVE